MTHGTGYSARRQEHVRCKVSFWAEIGDQAEWLVADAQKRHKARVLEVCHQLNLVSELSKLLRLVGIFVELNHLDSHVVTLLLPLGTVDDTEGTRAHFLEHLEVAVVHPHGFLDLQHNCNAVSTALQHYSY